MGAKKTANARCYSQLQKAAKESMNSCGKNLSTWGAEESLGDYLCGQVNRWLGNKKDYQENGKDNITIAFMYSQCGKDWEYVSEKEVRLTAKDSLCCGPDGKYNGCDVEGFKPAVC